MAAIGGDGYLTLADVAKNKERSQSDVAEVLTKTNLIINDIPYRVANKGTYHVESLRSTLPTGYYRRANQVAPASKSVIEDRTFQTCHYESKSEMDIMVADRGGNRAFNRWLQAKGHIISMGHEHAELIINGSPEDDVRKTPGLADVYSTFDTSEADTANQLLDGGGTGSDNSSIYLVGFSPESIFGIYEEGTDMGIKSVDDGEVDIYGLDHNAVAGTYRGLRERFMLDHGLVVKDYRQAARLCNVDVPALVAGTGVDLIEEMIKMTHLIHNLEMGNFGFYMNRTLKAWLDLQAYQGVKAGGQLSYSVVDGKPILTFRGIPIKLCDAITDSQARIVPV